MSEDKRQPSELEQTGARRPGWELEPRDDDATEGQWTAYRERVIQNLADFLSDPRASYSRDEVADMLCLEPDRVGSHMMAPPDGEGRYSRKNVFDSAISGGTWTSGILDASMKLLLERRG